MRISIAASLVILLVSACEKTIINHGHVVDYDDFRKKIVPGKDTAMSVYSSFGSPTMRSSVIAKDGSYKWYYVSKLVEKSGFLDPKVIDQKTVIIGFSSDNVVRSMEVSKYESAVATVSEKTKTDGKTAGIVGETFGGLGKYMKRFTDRDGK